MSNADKIKLQIRRLGYRLAERDGGIFTLTPASGPNFIHNKFRSVTSAADYLVQITHDDTLREMVSGL